MKKKLGLVALALALTSGWSTMQAQVKLVVHSVDGTLLEANLGDVKSLAFKETGFNLSSKANQLLGQFAFKDVKKIEFLSTTTGVSDVIANSSQLGLNISHNALKITGWNGNSTPVNIFGVSGQCYYNEANWNGSEIDITTLPTGVYVLKVNNETFKFRK